MRKEAKKKKVKKKKVTVKPCSNEFLDFQKDQFSYQNKQDQKFESMFREHFSERWKIDQEQRQSDQEFLMNSGRMLNGNNDNK